MAPGDNRNRAAQAGDAAARAAGEHHKIQEVKAKNKDLDPSVIERIVAEERESQGKLPKYPGLERWTLLEKMGDGAFSNVYRAKDTTGKYQEVAIKVVRKFEMNASQVCSMILAFHCLSCIYITFVSLHTFTHALSLPQSCHANSSGALGPRPPSSRRQESAQSCGGAQISIRVPLSVTLRW